MLGLINQGLVILGMYIIVFGGFRHTDIARWHPQHVHVNDQ